MIKKKNNKKKNSLFKAKIKEEGLNPDQAIKTAEVMNFLNNGFIKIAELSPEELKEKFEGFVIDTIEDMQNVVHNVADDHGILAFLKKYFFTKKSPFKIKIKKLVSKICDLLLFKINSYLSIFVELKLGDIAKTLSGLKELKAQVKLKLEKLEKGDKNTNRQIIKALKKLLNKIDEAIEKLAGKKAIKAKQINEKEPTNSKDKSKKSEHKETENQNEKINNDKNIKNSENNDLELKKGDKESNKTTKVSNESNNLLNKIQNKINKFNQEAQKYSNYVVKQIKLNFSPIISQTKNFIKSEDNITSVDGIAKNIQYLGIKPSNSFLQNPIINPSLSTSIIDRLITTEQTGQHKSLTEIVAKPDSSTGDVHGTDRVTSTKQSHTPGEITLNTSQQLSMQQRNNTLPSFFGNETKGADNFSSINQTSLNNHISQNSAGSANNLITQPSIFKPSPTPSVTSGSNRREID